jgi:peptidase M50B-like protein
MEPMFDLWTPQPTPPHSLVLATGVVALALVAFRPAWRLARIAVTIAHEGGHALIAVLSGRRLQAIQLRFDTSGLTLTKGKRRGLGMFLTLFVGYIAPSLLGLGGAFTLANHRIKLTLWITLALLFLMLIMIRNFYGLLAVLITGGLVLVITWYASAQVQAAFAYIGIWFLLLGGVRPVFELGSQRRRGQARDSDADQLAALTHVAGGIWVFLYALLTLAGLGLGAYLLGIRGAH